MNVVIGPWWSVVDRDNKGVSQRIVFHGTTIVFIVFRLQGYIYLYKVSVTVLDLRITPKIWIFVRIPILFSLLEVSLVCL